MKKLKTSSGAGCIFSAVSGTSKIKVLFSGWVWQHRSVSQYLGGINLRIFIYLYIHLFVVYACVWQRGALADECTCGDQRLLLAVFFNCSPLDLFLDMLSH